MNTTEEIKSITILKRCLKKVPNIDQEWAETIEAWHTWAVRERLNKADGGFKLIRIALGLEKNDASN